MMFWGAIRSDGRKMLIEWTATLNSDGYLEILKQYGRHLNIPDLVFQQDNAPVHKSSRFSGSKAMGGAGLASFSPDLNPIENIWAIFEKSLRGQIVTWENLEEKVYNITPLSLETSPEDFYILFLQYVNITTLFCFVYELELLHFKSTQKQ